jgi:hypothetical protein
MQDVSRFNDLVCTANDVRIAEYLVINAPEACYPGDLITVDLQAHLIAGAQTRFDIGFFIALDKGNALNGTCYQGYLPPPLQPQPSACTGTPDPTSGSGPYYNAECSADPNDLCGDLQGGVTNYLNLPTLSITCQDSDNDGKADLAACVSWDNGASDGSTNKPSCVTKDNTLPNTKSKCRCESIKIGTTRDIPIGGKIIVKKTTDPAGDSDSFLYSLTSGTFSDSFALKGTNPVPPIIPGTANGNTYESIGLKVGTYTLDETSLTEWWDFTSLSCTSSLPTPSASTFTIVGKTATIELKSKDVVTCTYTNTKRGTIIINKTANGGDDTFAYTTTGGDGLPAVFAITTLNSAGSQSYTNIVPGSYSITEDSKAGWTLTSSSCDSGSPGSFTVLPGQTVTCTFVNTRTYHSDLTVTKTATASFSRLYKWLIDKSVDKTQINIAEGGTATFNYMVKPAPDGYTDSAWVVNGKITVANSNAFDISGVNVTDAIDNGGASCTVTGGTNVTVPANGSIVLDYSCTYAVAPVVNAGTNTATAVWDRAAYDTVNGSASGTANFDFAIVTPAGTNKTVKVVDDKTDPANPVTLGTSDYYGGPFEYSYSLGKQGVAGACTDYTNTAKISETGQSDTQTVTVCVGKDLTVTKTASGTFDRTYSWLIDKSVDQTRINIAEGGTATFLYSVKTTTSGYTDSNWAMSGTITVTNPNNWQDITVDVADAVAGGACTVTGGTGVVVAKSSSATLNYTCTFTNQPEYTGKNTATATWDKAAFFTPNGTASGEKDVTLALKNETNRTITVKDDKTDPANPVTLGTSDYYAGPFAYTYSLGKQGVAGTCTDYTNTAVIDQTKQADTQTVTVCVAKDLAVTKTASGTFDRTYRWLIDKSVDDTRIEIAQGGTATFNYTVKSTPDGYTDSGWAMGGKITVSNPNDWEAITVDVSDAFAGGVCTVTGGNSVVVAAGQSVTLDYTCAFSSQPVYSGKNTATATWNAAAYFTPTGTASGEADVTLTLKGETNRTITVMDDKTTGTPITLGTSDYYVGPFVYAYSLGKQGVAGTCTNYTNTAVIDETRQSDSQAVTVCVGKDLTVTKTAAPSFTRTWNWTIAKDADATYNLFAGQNVTHGYKVTVTPQYSDSLWQVVGKITVSNPNDWEAITATIGDAANGGICVVDDPSVSVPAGGTMEVAYTCTWAAMPSTYQGTNTATVTWSKAAFFTPNDSASGSKGYEFTSPTEINPVITVDDNNLTGESWNANRAYAEWTYTKEFACSANQVDYAGDGKYDYSLVNTAKINETGQADIATVVVNCYAPVVSKTAAGAYDERHDWALAKSVSPVSQSAFLGDTVAYAWTVTATESVVEQNFLVSGETAVVNPAPMEMTVGLTDTVGFGTPAAIGSCTNGTYAGGILTIPANSTATCGYIAAPAGRTDMVNTVTATLNNIAFSASAVFGWTANVIRASALLTDDQNPAFPLTITDGGTWTYTEQYTCSTDKTVYDATTHKYSFSESNTATLTANGFTASADASTSVDCYVPTIGKTANGDYSEIHDWEVFKSVNTASQTAFAGEKKNFTWTVRVDETTHGEDYVVHGEITVYNPNPEDALTVMIADVMKDGTNVAIGPCTGGTWASPNLAIPAGGTAVCEYSGAPKGSIVEFNNALPATVTMSVQYPYAGGPAYFPVTTVSGDAALNGTYEGWCVDIDNTISQNTNYTANVYSSYETLPAGLIEKPQNLDLVNWIINQDYVGKPAGGSLGNYTYGDVQRAIWELIEDNGASNTNGLNSWNQTRVNQIKAAAMANGEGFVPTCGDFVGVILQPVGGQQAVTIAQVTFASLGLACIDENSVTAWLNEVAFNAGATIVWAINKVNETATLDDDQKPDWPTTVSADTTFTYQDPQGYTCSTDPAAYTNGYYQYNENNTAVLTFETGSKTATASTAVKCYAPVVSKTAAGAYDERHEWAITKSVTPASQDVLAGSTGSFEWTVTVTESVFEESFVASGTISVKNPRTDDGNMTVKLTDLLSDSFAATITGCTSGTWNATNKTVAVAPNTTAVCSYTASLSYSDDAAAPTSNTVTAELMVGTTHFITTASDAIEWAANVIRASATLDDDQNPAFPLNIADGGTWTYSDSYTCSANQGDYANGSYTHPETNTATVTSGDRSSSASATTGVICHAPVVTKDAATYFNRDWDWTITKDYDATYDLFAGGSTNHGYKVTVTPTYSDNFWGVKGNITITNSHPTQAIVLTGVSDWAGGINGVVTCPSLNVPAAGSLVCTYDTGAQDKPNANPFGGTNTATAIFAATNWTGSAAIIFGTNPATENEPVIHVSDTNGQSWSADRAKAVWTYTKEFACSTSANYVNGKYSYSLKNTATITETTQSDDATVNVNCYAPKVTKTAVTYWNRDWDWTIVKDYDGTYKLFAGDTVTHSYKVTVTPTHTDNFWGVKGDITVYNYNPAAAMTLTSLTDLAGGINGNVTCDSLVVPAGGSLTCSYDTGAQTAPDANPFGSLNTATAVFAGSNWTGTYPIVFSSTPTTENEPVITVNDDNLTGESWSADRAAGEWTYTKSFVCSTNPNDFSGGKYAYSHNNTATINETSQTDTAKVDVACYWPQIDLSKTGDPLSKIGDGVTYLITAYNNTAADAGLRALSCTITDSLIGFSKTVTLASGAYDTSTQGFIIPAVAADPFNNTASMTCKPVAASAPVVGSSTFSVSDSSTWSTNLFQPQVEIIKTGPLNATSGEEITYTFTINNKSSSDSPNLQLDSISDNVIGDLKAAALAAGCDNLAPGGTCTFTASFTHNLADPLKPATVKNIVAAHYHPSGFPNDIWDDDDHTVTVVPKGQLTDTSFCPLPNNQFRQLYHLEVAPNVYRLQATNPGQFYYNAFYYGEPGGSFTMTIQVPYPFVTQEGAGVPIQVHDGTTLNGSGCYVPTPSLSGFTVTTQAMTPVSSAGNQIITPEDYTTKQLGQYTTVTISGTVPATGLVYVTIHLDEGIKKTGGWKQTGTFTTNPVTGASIADVMNQTGFGSGSVTKHGYEVFTFSRTVGGDAVTSTPSSYNEFKKFAGFLGFVIDTASENPVVGKTVQIYSPTKALLTTLTTDADGYYMFPYKHTAKSATYTVKLPQYNKSVSITVKANGFAAVNFDVP